MMRILGLLLTVVYLVDSNPITIGYWANPGVYGRDPSSTGGGPCLSPLDCSINRGKCEYLLRYNTSVCVCNAHYSNSDCSYVRTHNGGLLLMVLGWCFVGYLPFFTWCTLEENVQQSITVLFYIQLICVSCMCIVEVMRNAFLHRARNSETPLDQSLRPRLQCMEHTLTLLVILYFMIVVEAGYIGIRTVGDQYTDADGYELISEH